MTDAEYRAKVCRYRTYVPTRRKRGITDVAYTLPTVANGFSAHRPSDDPFNDSLHSIKARKPFTGFGNDNKAEKKAAAKSRL